MFAFMLGVIASPFILLFLAHLVLDVTKAIVDNEEEQPVKRK